MKFTVEGSEFKKYLQIVSKAINSKNALQILNNILFEVMDGKLYLTGSDTETSLRVSIPVVDHEGEGSLALDAKLLLDITKEMASQPIHFDVNESNNAVEMKYHNGEFQFMAIAGKEYPRPKEDAAESEQKETLTLPASVVRKGINRTIYAVSADTIRPTMTGIYWDIHPEDITFVASDTHKLVKYVNKETRPEMERSFIMAAKPAGILANVITDDKANITITITGRHARFELEGKVLTCQFINGNYPPYERVIPKDNPYRLTIDRAALLSAMRRVAILASKASSLVKFDIDNSIIKLSGQDADFSTHSEERLHCEYEGSPITIGFSAEYTIDILQNLTGDTTVIELSDPARPGVFHPFEKEDGEELITIQMPIQVI